MAIKASYTEIYDMQTEDNAISALKIHSPIDGTPISHLGGMFAQFRRYKYLGADIALVPAQTLPLDPLQVSTIEGDNLAAPQDILNPILHKHYSGERTLLDMFLDGSYTNVIMGSKGLESLSPNGFAGGAGRSIDETLIPQGSDGNNAELFYGNLLMDNSWRASHVQAVLRLRVRPFVWDVQSTRPLGNTIGGNTPIGNNDNQWSAGGAPQLGPAIHFQDDQVGITDVDTGRTITAKSDGAGGVALGYIDDWQFIGSGTMPLNWLPTNPTMWGNDRANTPVENTASMYSMAIRIPKIYMHMIVLPPAIKQNMYYRLAIKHKFLFKQMSTLRAIDAIDVQTAYSNQPNLWAPITPASRMAALGKTTEYLKGSESSLEAFGTTLKPMGSMFETEVTGDEWDMSQRAKVKSLEEQINEILEKRTKEEVKE